MQLETEQDMEDWLNKITYGNINQTMVKEIQKKCIGDEVIPIIDKKYKNQLTPPKNNSQTVKDELNQITEMVSSLSDESNKEHLRRYLRYDKQLLQVILLIILLNYILLLILKNLYKNLLDIVLKNIKFLLIILMMKKISFLIKIINIINI